MVYLAWLLVGVGLLIFTQLIFFVTPKITSVLDLAESHWEYFYLALTAHDLFLATLIFLTFTMCIRTFVSIKISLIKIAIVQIPLACIALPEVFQVIGKAGDIKHIGFVYYIVISQLFLSLGLILIWFIFSKKNQSMEMKGA